MPAFIFSQYLRSLVKVPLHWVLVVPFVLPTVGAVGLVGYFSYLSGQEAVEDLAHRLLVQVSERVSDRLDRYLQTSQQIVAINHLAVKQGSLKINDVEQLQQHLWEQIKLNPSLTSNSFWSTQGEAIGYGRLFSEKERYYASKLTGKKLILGGNYFMKINKLNPSQRQFYRINDQGKPTKLMYSMVDVDFRQLPWYQQAKARRKQIWASISVNRIIPFLQIQALAPIYNSAGEYQGNFNSSYFLSDLSKFLHQQKFSASGQVFIIERSGYLVATSSLEKIYVKPAKGQPKRLLAVNSRNARTREIAQQLINQFGSFYDLKNIKQLNLLTNNQQHFVQVTPHQDNYGLDWLIVVIVPQSDFMGSINENLWRTIWLCGLTFLGTTAVGILSAYYITKSIRKLSRASQALAAGNWQNVELGDSAIQEISVLAQSFNCTAEQLQQSFEQIKTALQESEARFTKVFRTCPDPISINQLGDGGKYLEVNDSFLQFSEYSREEVIDRTPEELNFSADSQQNIIIWELLQKYGRIEGFEFRYRTKSGKLGTSLLSIELVELDGQQQVLTISKDISDRKQLELALQTSQAQLNDILNSAIAAISSFRVSSDGNWEINYISAGCEFISGYTPSELQADKTLWLSRIFPGDWEAITSQIYADIFAQNTGTYEYRLDHKNGSLRWISQTNTSRWDETLNCWIVTAVSLDITDRKQVEERLSKTEKWLHHYSNQSPSTIYTIVQELDGRFWFEYISSAVEAIHEVTKAQVLENAQVIFDQFHPDDRAGYNDALIKSVQNLELFCHEWRIITPSGKIKWLQANCQPERRSNGALAWHGVISDITERKEAQEALRHNEERFQQLAAASPGVIYTVIEYPSGPVCYEYLSPAFEEIHEIPVREVLQDASITFNQIHPDDRDGYQQAVKECWQTGKPFKYEWRIITPSGKIKWIQANSRLQRRENGELAWHGVVLDISDRKLVEEKLRKTEKWLNQFSHSSPSAIYTLVREPDGLFWFEYMSSACEAINEVTAEQALKDASSILGEIHPEYVSGYDAAVSHSAETLELFCYQWQIITPSGKLKWLQANSQPERRINGAVAWHGVVLDITAQKQTEQALQQALQHIDTHFDECPLAILQWNRDFQILRWSKQAERIFGWTAEEVQTLSWQEFGTEGHRDTEAAQTRGQEDQGKEQNKSPRSLLPSSQSMALSSPQCPMPWKFVYEEDFDRVNAEITPLINGFATSKAVQNRNYTKDGRVIVCQWYSSAVFDATGNLISVLSFAQDITDRQKIEAALLESEQTNRALVQSIPDLLIRISRNGTYLDVRIAEGIKLFNAEKTKQGASVFDVFPPDLAQERFDLIQSVLAAKEVQIQEYKLEIEDEIHYEEARIVPYGVDEVLIIVRDVTDRKRMEAALRESEERFRRAFDDAAIGMALVALDGRFLQVNIALCEITGYSEVELLGNFFQDITHPDDLDKDFEYIRQVLTGKRRTYQIEKRYIHKSGHFVWGLLGVSVVNDQEGNCLYFVTQVQDISERHEIDRIKDEFISIVSHELRTPLTAIRGSLGILETGVLDNRPEKAKYMLQVAVKNSERLVRLVNDILDLERLESGKVKFVMENCQVEDLMQQAIESVQAIANQGQITLEVTHLVAEIWASSDAIIQALTNLLSNAIKFSPPHSTIWLSAEPKNSEPLTEENPNVNVQAIPELPPTPYILFQVRDQGRGIPAEKLETIFGRFQQVDLSDSRQKGGTGLGLAICKSIVQQHGGNIWVESVLGQGSAFYFTLPIKNKEV